MAIESERTVGPGDHDPVMMADGLANIRLRMKEINDVRESLRVEYAELEGRFSQLASDFVAWLKDG